MVMSDLNDYERMKIWENLKKEVIENCKLVYGNRYPNGHDWAIHYSCDFEHDAAFEHYMAFVVVYNSRNSIRDRDIAVASPEARHRKEDALQVLIDHLRVEVTEYFTDHRARSQARMKAIIDDQRARNQARMHALN